MSDNANMGFSKLVPGFDFLQNLAKGASQAIPQMPMSNWVAPTLNVEELEKRIAEMKAVQFWLDQNARALAATVQALEVQKMTLATLKGMNMNMAEMASALRARTADAVAAAAEKADETAAKAAKAAKAAEAAAAPAGKAPEKESGEKGNGASSGVVDPLQWWGALTQQFQQIAADAMKDAARSTSIDTARNTAVETERDSGKSAADAASAATKAAATRTAATRSAGGKSAPAKAARKAAARKRSAKSTK